MKVANEQKIYFLLAARFPTEKAYGVTTEYSARTVEALGYPTLILTPKKDSRFQSAIEIKVVASLLHKILMAKSMTFANLARMNMFLILYGLWIRVTLPSKTSLFWTRDLFIAGCLGIFSKRKIIFELHRIPKGVKLRILTYLAQKRNIIICPISDIMIDQLSRLQNSWTPAYMAVQESELCKIDNIRNRQAKIIYLGNPSSSGIPLDMDLLNDAATEISKMHKSWSFTLIGITEDDFCQKVRQPLAPNIEFKGHVSREEVFKELSQAAMGLVIYPNSTYFRDSFPIKIVEYAASGLAIVASCTDSHKRILSNQTCLFFDSASLSSLVKAIDYLISNPSRRVDLAINARQWATHFTYQERVRRILQEVCKM